MSADIAEFPHISIAHTDEIVAEPHLSHSADVMSARPVRLVFIHVPNDASLKRESE
ncbi:hypothetical protein [Pelagibacterium sediminicola]|uniref:hypothetical protein n=1 Tax=Pelagibacterium sediminicola TaxID=2248761 RepID=UPI0013007F6C|nr:hypothetical protein [Pelagibacterium sediminicola]